MDRAALVSVILLLLPSCAQKPRVVVGSKNFTEQVLLGEIISQQIERRLGISVERKLNLGGTLLAHEALRTGGIDLYPEYTGTALTTVLKQPPASNPAAVFEKIHAEYAERWKLEWLRPLGFNNTFAMVVRAETPVTTLSDAAKSRAWRLGVGYEFLKRPDGFDGLMRTYGLRLEGSPVTMDLGLLYSAIQSNKVDMLAANSTDGLLSVLPLKILVDDKAYFPPYECAIVVRQEALQRQPELRAVLEQLSGTIPNEAMRKLNHSVDGEHKPVRSVAAEFLDRIK
jgi:glycine betaine/choline ABC-type transport system substrate-binding protein